MAQQSQPFELGKFSWNRPLTSYTRFHVFMNTYITPHLRNRKWMLRDSLWKGREYLNVGCGYNFYDGFVNLDWEWKPGVLPWDISRLDKEQYPFPDSTFKGIYTEHCIEHVDINAGWQNFREFYRILKPGGTLRVIVPDGEIYFNGWIAHREGKEHDLPYAKQHNEATPMISINRIFRYGHHFIYDFETMEYMLRTVGFKEIRKEKFGSGRDPILLKDSKLREVESLYVECVK